MKAKSKTSIKTSQVSARKATSQQAEAQIEYQANLLKHINDAVIAVDGQFRITAWNQAAETMYGWSAAEVIGRTSTEVIRSEMTKEKREEALQQLQKFGTYRSELIQYRKDGQPVYVETNTITIYNEHKQVTGILSVNRNITERKQAEEKLRESEDKFKYMFDHSIIGKTITLPDGGITVNQAFCEMLGYPEEELIHKKWQAITHPDDIELSENAVKLLLAGEKDSMRFIKRYIHKNGSVVWVDVSTSLRRDEQGQPVYFMTAMVDITERKHAEETLRDSEVKFSAAFQSTPLALVITTLGGKFIETNRAFCKLVGYSHEEIIGKTAVDLELLSAEERERLIEALKNNGGSVNNFEVQFRVRDGSLRDILYSLETISFRGRLHRLSTGLDITERKQAEQELRNSATQAQTLAEISRALAAVHLDYQSVLDTIARRMVELIGDLCNIHLLSEDGQWFDLAAVYHPDSAALAFFREMLTATRSRVDEGLSGRVIQTGQSMLLPVTSPEQIKTTLNAKYWPLLERFPIHSILVVPLRAQGRVLGVLSMIRTQPERSYTSVDQSFLQDLADRAALAIANARLYTAMQQLNAELEQRVVERTAALSGANSLLQMLLDNMPDHIYFKDTRSRFIKNSRSQATALGLSDPAEAIGRSDFDFFPHAQLSYEKEQEIIRSGKPLIDQEEQVVWPDGRETWVSTTKMPLLEQTGQIIGTFGISRDITDRKRAEVELQKAKMELESANKELEAFAYSVSHDLRTPLRSIDGFSQALLEDYADLLPEAGRSHLKRVRASAQHMAELIDDLLNLSRVTRAVFEPGPVDLSLLAQNIASELQHSEPGRAVEFNIAPDLIASGDARLLQIVLENLLNNAWKFTSKQAQAQIEFGSKNGNDETIYFVRDNGAGFDMTYAGKLFGAFQRLHTMTEYPGTGIGLATVQRIIHRHSGRIWVESVVDQGATFYFSLSRAITNGDQNDTVGGRQP